MSKREEINWHTKEIIGALLVLSKAVTATLEAAFEDAEEEAPAKPPKKGKPTEDTETFGEGEETPPEETEEEEEQEEEEEEQATIEQVRKAFQEFTKKQAKKPGMTPETARAKAVKILKTKFKVERVDALKKSQYQEAIEAVSG